MGIDPTKAGAPAGENPSIPKDGQQSAAGDGGQGDLPEREWMQDLPEPLRTTKTLRKFADKAGLAKSYVELESKLGRSVALPKEDATAEEWDMVFSKLGRPNSAGEYELPEGKLDKDLEQKLRERAHKRGLSKMQLSDIAAAFAEWSDSSVAAMKSTQERNRVDVAAKLRGEYGKDYEKKMASAEVAMGALFPDSVRAALIATGIKDSEDFLKSMVSYGEKFGNSQFVRGVPAVAGGKQDPYEWMRAKYGQH